MSSKYPKYFRTFFILGFTVLLFILLSGTATADVQAQDYTKFSDSSLDDALHFSPAQDASVTSDTFGFNAWCFRGWKKPTLDDLTFFNLETTYTDPHAQKANDWLIKAGYQSTYHKNATQADARSRLPGDSVFFYFGHGLNNGLVFIDDHCNYSPLWAKDLASIAAPKLKLVVLLACLTGQNTGAADNILVRFRAMGAKKVIGFNRVMAVMELESWNGKFWTYTVQDKMEAGDAARKATLEATFLGIPHAIDPSNLVILGTENVYLTVETVTPPKTNWLEDLQKKLDEFLRDLQRRALEFMQKQLQALTQKLLEELLAKLQQICLAPVGICLMFALPAGVRWLQKRKNEGGDR